jgi:hypothetical protein
VNWTTVFKHRARALPRNPVPDHRRVYDAIAGCEDTVSADPMLAQSTLALEDTGEVMAGIGL